ncbi:MAG: lysophospholipid acyltransferase family protein [Gemmataceae bacterium]
MKIRNRHLVRFAGTLGSRTARTLVSTLRAESIYEQDPIIPSELPPGSTDRYIYAIWHEALLFPTVYFGHPDLAVLISKHADGQILGSLIQSMNMGMVLGSTNRGGIAAVKELISDPNARRHLAVTPDGPRGPRRVVQPGVVYIASRAQMQIVCVGVGHHRPWRARSWDRFMLPYPTARVRSYLSKPIAVPAGLKTEGLEEYRRRVQTEMDRVMAIAENWAETNQKPNQMNHRDDSPLVPLVRAA